MKLSPKETLRELAANSSNQDREIAPLALRAAFEWCQSILSVSHYTSPLDALVVLGLLSQAVDAGSNCLRELPPMINYADVGDTLKSKLEQGRKELESVQAQLAGFEQQAQVLQKLEHDLRNSEARRTELDGRIQELKRLESMAKDLDIDKLQQQAAELGARVLEQGGKGQRIQDLELELSTASKQLILLSNEELQKLDPSVQSLLSELAKRENDRRLKLEQLVKLKKRYDEIERSLGPIEEALRLYGLADRDVANALPAAESAKDLLAEAERLLRRTDVVLKDILKANAAAKTLPELSF